MGVNAPLATVAQLLASIRAVQGKYGMGDDAAIQIVGQGNKRLYARWSDADHAFIIDCYSPP